MRFQIERMRSRIRIARGRCPACDSSGISCGVCLDYTGPFPVGAATQLRWWSRYETMLREFRQERFSSSVAPGLLLEPRHRRSA
jgi:hypothetical protein